MDVINGFPQAIDAVFPQTQVQTCIVHLIRNSLDFVNWKDSKLVAAELKTVYRATTERAIPWRNLLSTTRRAAA
jgi:transposase-like protein